MYSPVAYVYRLKEISSGTYYYFLFALKVRIIATWGAVNDIPLWLSIRSVLQTIIKMQARTHVAPDSQKPTLLTALTQSRWLVIM